MAGKNAAVYRFTGEGLQTFARFQSELYKQIAGDGFKQMTYDKASAATLKGIA